MKLYILDIGNTHTRYGLMNDNKIVFSGNIDTTGLNKLEIPDDTAVAASTVVPEAKKLLKRKDIFWINNTIKLNMDLSQVDSAKLGADRIANLAALIEMNKYPGIIIDCGTAVNIEVIDSNKVFRGGLIAPGRYLQRKALNNYTALLPLVNVDNKESQTLGLNTEDAIRIGTDAGVIGTVREFLYNIKKKIEIDSNNIYVTGGDADVLLKNIEGLKSVSPDFTLLGIAALWKYNN